MNKLLIFPLFIMLILLMINGIATGTNLELPEDTIDTSSGMWVNNQPPSASYWYWLNNATGTYYGPARYPGEGELYNPNTDSADPFILYNPDTNQYMRFDDLAAFTEEIGVTRGTPNLFMEGIMWGVLIMALGVGVAVSVTVIGTGISEYGQNLIFTASVWGGVWGFATLGTLNLLQAPEFGILGWAVYIALTLMFIFGLIGQVQSGSEG